MAHSNSNYVKKTKAFRKVLSIVSLQLKIAIFRGDGEDEELPACSSLVESIVSLVEESSEA